MEYKYNYTVNTFISLKDGLNPIQRSGSILAESEVDAINKLIDDGIVYAKGYEFLDLYIDN